MSQLSKEKREKVLERDINNFYRGDQGNPELY